MGVPLVVEMRRAGPDDMSSAIKLAADSLGWDRDQPNEAFFRWKHFENPFGRSPMWLAHSDGELVGFRAFLRWALRRPDGTTAKAVRTVDTATHSEFRGQGIFSELTMRAVEELRDEGVDFVFNTPNDKSRPGYLKMGWVELGKLPLRVRPKSPTGLVRMARAKAPAEKWSASTSAGIAAPLALSDTEGLEALLDAQVPPRFFDTLRSVGYLRWRYGFTPLNYRAVSIGSNIENGLCLFRVRRRGGATEATICELLVPGGDRSRTAQLASGVRRAAGADYLVWSGPAIARRAGFVPLPGQGPMVTWRALAQTEAPRLRDMAFTLGDIELF